MYDVAVIGLGAFGAHTLWQLALRGLKVVGLDQYATPHPFGSSHGHTRLFREACMEHVELGRVARRSMELWRGLEAEQSVDLLDQSGTITVGRPDSDYISGAIAAARRNGVPIETYSAEETAKLYPAFENLDPDEIGVLDTSGGAVAAEGSIRAALDTAQALGGDIVGHARVDTVQRTAAGVTLVLSSGQEIRAAKLVLAVGPWLARLAKYEGLDALRTAMNWWDIDPAVTTRPLEAYRAPKLMGFIRRFDDMSIWGHGDLDGRGLKIGLSLNSKSHEVIDPDSGGREIVPGRDWQKVQEVASRTFPALSKAPRATRPCMITSSPDDQFIIGGLTGDDAVFVAGACHGHGFKHSASIGEYLAQRVVDEAPTVEPGIWDPKRFEGLGDSILESLFARGMALPHA